MHGGSKGSEKQRADRTATPCSKAENAARYRLIFVVLRCRNTPSFTLDINRLWIWSACLWFGRSFHPDAGRNRGVSASIRCSLLGLRELLPRSERSQNGTLAPYSSTAATVPSIAKMCLVVGIYAGSIIVCLSVCGVAISCLGALSICDSLTTERSVIGTPS